MCQKEEEVKRLRKEWEKEKEAEVKRLRAEWEKEEKERKEEEEKDAKERKMKEKLQWENELRMQWDAEMKKHVQTCLEKEKMLLKIAIVKLKKRWEKEKAEEEARWTEELIRARKEGGLTAEQKNKIWEDFTRRADELLMQERKRKREEE